MTLTELKHKYEEVCNEYVKKFQDKQDLEFSFWVGNEVGGIACFIDQYFFSLSDIALDLHTKQPKGLILQWEDDGLDIFKNPSEQRINYHSYTLGLRYENLVNSKEF